MKQTLRIFILVACFACAPVLYALNQSQSGDGTRLAPQGEGRWVYINSAKAAGHANSKNAGGISGKYEWSVPGTKSPTAAPSILIYADDVGSAPPNTSTDKALQSAGLAYTAHYNGDFTGFVNSLTTGTWSLVIFAHQTFNMGGTDVYTPLDNYVRSGGHLIFMSWQVGAFSTHPLITDLGVQYVSDTALGPPPPVHWWYPQHRITNGVPEFTTLSDFYGIDGQFTNALPGTSTIAGYTPNVTSGQGTIFTANNNRTIYVGFLEGNNQSNLDADAQNDGVELQYNMICFALGSPLVLVYTDNFINALPPNTFPDLALRSLGFVYTPVYTNPDGNFAPLITLKNWDLIVIAADGTTPNNTTRTALNTYVTNGGKLVGHDWGAVAFGAGHPLYTTLGVALVASDTTPEQIHYWNSTHPFFNGVPELLSPVNVGGFVYGQTTNPAGGGTAIAGYTAAPSANNAGLIVANNNRTVFKAFLDIQHGADADADSTPDIEELWINMIRLVGAKNILAFDDDVFHAPTYLENALNKFGYAYTFTNSQATLQTLVPSRHWDMVLLACEEFSTNTTTKDELLNHVNSGGKLIYEDWSASAGHPINAALGSIYISEATNIPPIFWWQDSHPLFNIPGVVPEYTVLVDNYNIDTINVQPLNGNFQALAGATPAPAQNVANIVLGNSFRTIFKGFLDGNNNADLNSNGVPDGQELWANLVTFMNQPCLFCDDFDISRVDADWTVIKTSWTATAGQLKGTPVRKSVIYAKGFQGCGTCSLQTTLATGGGVGNKMWILGWYKDKNNTIEMLFKQESGKIVFKQRINGAIVQKDKILTTITPNVLMNVKVTYDGNAFSFFVNGSLAGTISKFPGSNWFGTVGYQVKLTTMTVEDVFMLP